MEARVKTLERENKALHEGYAALLREARAMAAGVVRLGLRAGGAVVLQLSVPQPVPPMINRTMFRLTHILGVVRFQPQ